MFKSQNFCHIASNNRNNVKSGVFIYRTTDDLATVTANGYFNERIIDINLHDIIIHEQIDNADPTKVKQNFLCVTQKTLTNINTKLMDTDEVDGANTDLDNLSDTGKANISAQGTYDATETYTAGTVGAALQGKANTDLDNLTATGANIANWSSNVTNCITEIPQDIQLTLSSGTLTLKADSKVYVPNGSGVFDEFVIANDITSNSFDGSVTRFVFIDTNDNTIHAASAVFSGSSAPTISGTGFWYDTTNNLVKKTTDSGATWTTGFSFPICIVTSVSDVATSIDQVFNGFGCVGSTVFVLPGVKGLIPNGRNADGSLNNTAFTVSSVKTYTNTNAVTSTTGRIYADGTILWSAVSDTYNPDTNYNISGSTQDNSCIFGYITSPAGGPITSFNPKTTFHAVDYNDTGFIAHQAMPSNRYINLTLAASVATLIAPADGYFVIVKAGTTAGQYMYLRATDSSELADIFVATTDLLVGRIYLPVYKGQSVGVSYNLDGTTYLCRFVYAQGVK